MSYNWPFDEIKWMVSTETLINYNYWGIMFIEYTNAYNKQLGAAIIQNHKPIICFLDRFKNVQWNYTTIEK